MSMSRDLDLLAPTTSGLQRLRAVPLATALGLVLMVCGASAMAQTSKPFEPNYDESKVPDYTLPDPLVTLEGKTVENATQWSDNRRPELVELFKTYVYGEAPPKPEGLRFEQLEVDRNALGGKATRKQVRVHFNDKSDGPTMDLLLYVPNTGKAPYPAFLGLNFGGNHTIHDDPAIRVTESWVRNDPKKKAENHRASEDGRGSAASRWPVERDPRSRLRPGHRLLRRH